MSEILDLWKNYNLSARMLAKKLGRTSNILGEYAEYLSNEFLKGTLLTASNSSADIELDNGELYQVKARKITGKNFTTQLGIIRSWNFDYLFVILFDEDGSVVKALKSPMEVAKSYASPNSYQNGDVVTTTQRFLIDDNNEDVTGGIREINGDSVLNQVMVDTRSKTSRKYTPQNTLKLSKAEALQYLNISLSKKGRINVGSRDVVFSNKNSANDKWWFEPNPLIFKRTFYLILNDQDSNRLFVFKIPVSTFSDPTNHFYLRHDTNRVSITIEGNDTKLFQDSLNKYNRVEFKQFLIETIEY